MTKLKLLGILVAIFGTLLIFSQYDVSHARKAPIYQGIVKGIAVGGYDPVAYFKVNKPVRGKKSITYKYKGATWRFSSQKNLETFKANPTQFAPQYGGYCAWAVSQGYTAKGDPLAWKVYKGKLYLNYNRSVQKRWAQDIPGNVKKGNKNWPTVLN